VSQALVFPYWKIRGP